MSNLNLAIEGLTEASVTDYVIIGGWCAYLNRRDKSHPGTIDVDILFKEGHVPYNLRKYIETMRRKGYFTSAKHHFQLLNVFDVNGEKFCFNIDLLHTSTNQQAHELFVDQLDLNVLLDDEQEDKVKMISIVQKESKVLFDEGLFEQKTLESGLTFNLIDYTGLFITKTKSCQSDKRDRDSYDIFLGFETGQVDIDRLSNICKRNFSINAHVQKFKEFISRDETRDLFDYRTKKFRPSLTISASRFISEKLKKIKGRG